MFQEQILLPLTTAPVSNLLVILGGALVFLSFGIRLVGMPMEGARPLGFWKSIAAIVLGVLLMAWGTSIRNSASTISAESLPAENQEKEELEQAVIQQPTERPIIIATQKPTIAPSTTPTPPLSVPMTSHRSRINFQLGASSSEFQSYLDPAVERGFVLGVAALQTIIVSTSQEVEIGLLDPHNNWVQLQQTGIKTVQARVHSSGDYIVVMRGNGNVNIRIEIPPLH